MELITLAAILCSGQLCEEKRITDSDQSGITYVQCKVGAQPILAQWIAAHPQYEGWEITRWECTKGKYIPKVGA